MQLTIRTVSIILCMVTLTWLTYFLIYSVASMNKANHGDSGVQDNPPLGDSDQDEQKVIVSSTADQLVFVKTPIAQVSFVIPFSATDTTPLLLRTLESIKSQSTGSWEVVVVVDGAAAKLDLASLADVLDTMDDRLRIVHKSQSTGVAHALNVGIHRARGIWIQPLLSGVTCAPDLLQQYFLELGAQRNASLSSTANTYNVVVPQVVRARDTSDSVSGASESGSSSHTPVAEYDPVSITNHNVFGSLAMFTKVLWQITGGFSPHLPAHFHWDFWIRCERRMGIRPASVQARIFTISVPSATSHLDAGLAYSLFITVQPSVFKPRRVLQAHHRIMKDAHALPFSTFLRAAVDNFEDCAAVWLWRALSCMDTENWCAGMETLDVLRQANWLRDSHDWQPLFYVAKIEQKLGHKARAALAIQRLHEQFAGLRGHI